LKRGVYQKPAGDILAGTPEKKMCLRQGLPQKIQIDFPTTKRGDVEESQLGFPGGGKSGLIKGTQLMVENSNRGKKTHVLVRKIAPRCAIRAPSKRKNGDLGGSRCKTCLIGSQIRLGAGSLKRKRPDLETRWFEAARSPEKGGENRFLVKRVGAFETKQGSSHAST